MPDDYEAVLLVKKKGEAAGTQGPYFEYTLAKGPDDKGTIYRNFSTTDAEKIHVGQWYKLRILEKPMKEGKGVFRNVESVIAQVDAPGPGSSPSGPSGPNARSGKDDGGEDDGEEAAITRRREVALGKAVQTYDFDFPRGPDSGRENPTAIESATDIVGMAKIFEEYLATGQLSEQAGVIPFDELFPPSQPAPAKQSLVGAGLKPAPTDDFDPRGKSMGEVLTEISRRGWAKTRTEIEKIVGQKLPGSSPVWVWDQVVAHFAEPAS